jgi:hypothetical protein
VDRQGDGNSYEDIVTMKKGVVGGKAAPAPKLVKLIPVPGRYIQGVPAAPMEVSPERARELLAYTPAAFKKA